MSIELHPCAVRHARPLLNGAIISFGNELDDEGGGKKGEDGAKATWNLILMDFPPLPYTNFSPKGDDGEWEAGLECPLRSVANHGKLDVAPSLEQMRSATKMSCKFLLLYLLIEQ